MTCQGSEVGCPFPRRHHKYRTRPWICPNCGQGWRWSDEYPKEKWMRWPAPTPTPSPDLSPVRPGEVGRWIQESMDRHERIFKHKKNLEQPS